MEQIFGSPSDILDHRISGYHQYILQEPVHLCFVSQNLCRMLGYTRAELSDARADLYARLVHPEDRTAYDRLIRHLVEGAQTATAQYRLVCKDGRVLYVNDTVSVHRLDDGTLTADSVLTDITVVKAEYQNLRFLNDTVPCGLIRYTCEKQPRVTYINDRMLALLHFPEDRDEAAECLELYADNVYFMLPMEERRRFARFLDRVYQKGTPVAGEISVVRCDGTRARIYGWVTKTRDEQGNETFQSVCMDVTERYLANREAVKEQYLRALSQVYDQIFAYDFITKTVKYIHGQPTDAFWKLRDVPMQLQEATEQWIQNTVVREDRLRVQSFFQKVYAQTTALPGGHPPQVSFRTEAGTCTGIFLSMDAQTSLFCCRAEGRAQETDQLRSENQALKSVNESMQEMVMRFTEGVVAFELDGDLVRPLYASDNVCHFFGYTRDQWLALAQKRHTVREFVSQSGVDYEAFRTLLDTGEGDFTYLDIHKNQRRRIKAICSQKGSDSGAPRYVMLYNMGEAESETADGNVYIRTFGYFDVFVDGKPIAFRNEKSKELFALLVDRRGGYVTSEEAIGFLWENEPANAVTLARYRKVALRLKNILEEYGIADVVESVGGKRRIVTSAVSCDLYDYLSGQEEHAQLFKGSYLTNYSWGETTLGALLNQPVYETV